MPSFGTALLLLLLVLMDLDSVTVAMMQRYLTASAGSVDPLSLAFGKQREAIECREKQVAFLCSGRAGKTRAFLLKWLEVKHRKPGRISIYVALTRQSAKRIAWPQLKQMNVEHDLGLTFNEAELTVRDQKGSQLILLGANREDLIDVLRGFPMALIGFDEAAFFRNGLLQRAIDDAVLIRLMDLDGELWVMSTPGLVRNGYHYNITDGRDNPNTGIQGYRVFHWTFFDNPHLPLSPISDGMTEPEKRAWRVEQARKDRVRKGWTEDTPSYGREYLGKYADDKDARVYKVSRDIHCVQEMPKSWAEHRNRWTVVLGIDYGSTAAFALVLLAFEEGNPTVYMVRALKRYGLAPSLTADLTKKWADDYRPDVIVGDSASKGYIDEARHRHQLPIENADKLHKRSHIEWMNDAYRFVADGKPAPRLLIVEPECEDYLSEADKLGWNPKHDKGHPKYQQDEDPRAEKDALDAGLYAYTRCYAYLEGLPTEENEDGDKESDEDGDDHEGEYEYGHERRQRRARG